MQMEHFQNNTKKIKQEKQKKIGYNQIHKVKEIFQMKNEVIEHKLGIFSTFRHTSKQISKKSRQVKICRKSTIFLIEFLGL